MKMINVWEVRADGIGTGYTERDVGEISDLIKNMDDGNTLTFYKTIMSEEEYDALPEFQGF